MVSSITEKERLLTISEVADFLQIHEKTLREYIARGELKAIHLKRNTRITQEELDRYLQSHYR